jgi:hypothetical protein
MRKSQITYVVTMLVFAGGLWAILRIGSHLRAARNIAGEWQIALQSVRATPANRLSIHQSGRFLTGRLRYGGKEFQLSGDLQDSKFTLHSPGQPLAVSGAVDETGDRLNGRFEGEFSADFSAGRVAEASAR